MYGNQYMNAYNPQTAIDRINSQMAELERMKQQLQQPTPQQQPTNLTQNFQLAPNNREVIRYASSMEEVQRDMVIGDTPYFSRDMSIVWIKNTKGDIKTYELNEIVPKDSKDLQIEYLQMQLESLRKEVKIGNEQHNTNDIGAEDEPDTTTVIRKSRNAVEKSEPTSVSTISTSKKK